MSTSAKTPASEAEADTVKVAVVGNGASTSSYLMFDAADLTAEGAFLAGDVFLEVDEEFAVRLSFGDESVDATARVISLDHGKPGMNVTFAMSEEDKKKLQSKLAAS